MSGLSFQAAETERRMFNTVTFGIVASINQQEKTCRVKINDTFTTADLPWCVRRAGNVRTASMLSVGEQVLVLAPAGDIDQAVIIGSLYQHTRDAPTVDPDEDWVQYDDGAVISYNQRTHHLKATLPSSGTLEITASSGIKFHGDVTINGSLHTTGDTVAGSISLQQHHHGGVQAGGSNTGVPI